MTLDLESSNNNVQVANPHSFASIASLGSNPSQYSDGDTLVVSTGSFVTSTGTTAFCSTSPTIVLGVTKTLTAPNIQFSSNVATITIQTKNGPQPGYAIYTIDRVIDYGGCNTGFAPNFGAPVGVIDDQVPNQVDMTVTIAPTPSPLSLYNGMINADAITNFVKAYTPDSSPMLAPSIIVKAGSCVAGGPAAMICAGWGCPSYIAVASYCDNQQINLNIDGNSNPILPIEDTTNPYQWTVTLQRPTMGYSAQQGYKFLPLYMSQNGSFTNVACMKEDEEQASYVENPVDGYTEDVVFQNIKFLNHSRMTFQGILGANSASLPTADQYSPTGQEKLLYPAQSPVYANKPMPNQGVQLMNITIMGTDPSICAQTSGGGAQISGWVQGGGNGPSPIWGNYISNYSAISTADDSLAMFNDIGGQNATYAATINGNPTTLPTTYYPQTVVTDGGHSPVISNSFAGFIGSYNTVSDIKSAISTTALATELSLNGSSSGTWQSFQGTVSTAVSAGITGCDVLAISQCPLQLDIQKKPTSTSIYFSDGVNTITPPDYSNY